MARGNAGKHLDEAMRLIDKAAAKLRRRSDTEETILLRELTIALEHTNDAVRDLAERVPERIGARNEQELRG